MIPGILALFMQTRFSIRLCRSGKFVVLPLFCLACAWANVTDVKAADFPKNLDVGNTFYNNTKHGWFWYEDPPPEPEEEELEDNPVIKPPRIIPSLDKYSIDGLWNMYPDDFQELLNVLQKKAVQAPTEQNIMEYLAMQDVARRKALAYTNATMYVTRKYGDLFNVNQVYPTSGPGIKARVRMQQNEIFQTISRAGNDHALIFF